jgi:sodium-dependent dicarboxylate transporter 2/3/5
MVPSMRRGAERSDGENRLDRWRRRVGLVALPIATVATATAETGLPPAAHQTAVIALAVVIAWVCELVPLWIPAVAGPALAVALGVAPALQVFAPFWSPLIMLFLGGFILAAGMHRQGLDRRIALRLLTSSWVDGRPARALIAVALVTFVLSAWISNTATAAMMVPMAIGLCAGVASRLPATVEATASMRRYEEGVLITLAYAASMGGMCTPIGTAPNMLAIGSLAPVLNPEDQIDFLSWVLLATPIALIGLGLVLIYARWRFPPPAKRIEGLVEALRRELADLGPMRRGERRVLLIFGLAVVLWITPAIFRLTLGDADPTTQWVRQWLVEGWVALAAGFALLIVPTGDGERSPTPRLIEPLDAVRIDWGTLLLLAGGIALGKLSSQTGLAEAIGAGVLRMAPSTAFGLMAVATGLVVYLTELTSNTATTSMMLPIIIPAATLAGYDPAPVAISVAFAASFAFMMPVSTPPNAIVYGTSRVRFSSMMSFGFWLDAAGLVLLLIAGAVWLPLWF